MKSPVFAYAAPDNVAEACRLLAEDEDAKVLAGGQSLIPLLALRLAAPTTLVDLRQVPGLTGVEHDGGALRLGAMTTHRAIERSPVVRDVAPAIAVAASLIAHPQVRSRGTIGGAVAHADAAAEWPTMLLALGGSVEVSGVASSRTVAADDLFVGPFMTSLEPDEVITSVVLPVEGREIWVGEHQRRHGDYGLSILALSYRLAGGALTDVRLAVAGATGSVTRARETEAALEGRTPAESGDATAALAGELDYTADIHGSADYRRDITTTLFQRALRAAGERSGQA